MSKCTIIVTTISIHSLQFIVYKREQYNSSQKIPNVFTTIKTQSLLYLSYIVTILIQLSIVKVVDLPCIKLSNNNSFITWNNIVIVHRKYCTYSTHTYIGTIMIQLSIAEVVDLPRIQLSNNNSFITWNNRVLIHRKYYT